MEVRVLLDTHVFLWWITDDSRLSSRAWEVIADGTYEIFLSVASGWEIAIKAKLGRLRLPDDPERFILEELEENAIQPLPILMRHALHVYKLPDYRRDPLDRLLIAQTQLEELPVLTADPQISRYPVTVIW